FRSVGSEGLRPAASSRSTRRKCLSTAITSAVVLLVLGSLWSFQTTKETQRTKGTLGHYAIAAFPFGLVELVVGQLDEIVGSEGFVAFGGHQTKAHGDVVAPFLVLEGVVLNELSQALGHLLRAFAGGFRQHHHEFLAAISGEQFLFPDCLLDQRYQLTQGEISRQVP